MPYLTTFTDVGRSKFCGELILKTSKTKIKLGKTPAVKYTWTDNKGLKVAQFEVWDWWDGKNLSSFEIFGDYKGAGLSYVFLDYSKKLGVKNLAVKKENATAKHVYEKCGFRITAEGKELYYMSLQP